jgi:hypothetical protein
LRALILGARAPAALEMARRLASRGHWIAVADSVSCRITGSSRSVAETLRLPSPRTALAEYARALDRAIRQRSIDIVIPTCEEVFYLARVRAALPRECFVCSAPFELLARLHSKLDFIALAANCGASVPETCAVHSLEEARDWAAGRPLILKPEFSRFGVHVRIHPQGLPADATPLPPLGRWAAQLFCRGSELCSYGIAFEGALQVNVCYRPTYRLRRSSSYYFESAAVPAIDKFVARLVRETGFTGQISFDWIMGEDGVPTVLECNPRATSGLHLLPGDADLLRLLNGSAGLSFDADSARPAMLAALMLVPGLPTSLMDGTLARWRRDWLRAHDVLANKSDRAPALGAMRDLLSFFAQSLRQRCTMREAATRDIEWDGGPLQA